MICTFCGTENRQGNRFCGMCGVRLERRNTERRVHAQDGTKCNSCGYLNEPGYKFCGMCGLRVDRRAEDRRGAEEKSRATAMANAQLPTPELRSAAAENARTHAATMVAAQAERPRPHPRGGEEPLPLSGPSFLGLSDPPAEADYLLEEERSSGRGLRALVLLVVLAAIAGLIFVQYRSSLRANPRSPELPKPEPATLPQPHGQNQPPWTDKALAAVKGAQNLQSAVGAVTKAAVADPSETSSAEVKEVKKDAKKEATKETKQEARKNTSADTEEDDSRESASDPPSPTKNKPSAALVRAQQYLHGRGVRQNCEQGLVYLKAATEEGDPNAAVQMAALYSSGFCVRQDRVKAYQWFSSAREMQPENRWIVKNMNQLWAQMTPRERRLAR